MVQECRVLIVFAHGESGCDDNGDGEGDAGVESSYKRAPTRRQLQG